MFWPRIVFVDDEVNVLASLRRLLRAESQRWKLEFESDPEKALEDLLADPPDVVVLDIRMPQLSGIDIAKRLRAANTGTVVLMLTGSREVDLAAEAINAGNVFRFFLKPCEIATIVQGIEDALAIRGVATSAGPEEGEPVSRFDLTDVRQALIIVDASGSVRFKNDAADRVLDSRRFVTTGSNHRLVPVERDQETALFSAVEMAALGRRKTGLIVEGNDGSTAILQVAPYSGPDGSVESLACVSVFLEEQFPAPSPDMLVDLFSLTPSEARLTVELSKGLSLDDAAANCGITISSARTYLKYIFQKTDVSRQTQLVRKVIVSTASIF